MRCPGCKKEQSRILRIGISEDPDWPVYFCNRCRLHYIEPYFSDLREYYRSEYRKSHTETAGHSIGSSNISKQEPVETRYEAQHLNSKNSAKSFKELVPAGGSVLEIGCSAGGFLSHIVDDYECYGVEWNPEEAAFVRDIGEVPCEEGEFIDAFPGKKFTAIVARQVFEHVIDPALFLSQIRDRLIGGGWLFMEMPNANSALSAVYEIQPYQRWFYQAPHLTYWEPETLAHILSAHGFEARVEPIQRFGLLQAANWIMNGTGVEKLKGSLKGSFINTAFPKPVPAHHPLAPALNRIWHRLDSEYRIQMKTLGCNDQQRVHARRIEI